MDEIISQRALFSEDPSTLGFDLSSGNIWIYPENYPIRDYQFNIVKTALYHNTLVCLPTGLGKTFIAAVVMYNFWRWYPRGKVIFLAPTKPLVAQQIKACHEIMGIPSEETIELTGTTNQKHREIAWTHKRVIFATPQTFHKDLEKNIFPMNLVKCIVIDEAHKALGKHSYCESIRLLSAQNKYFRVLALSATPGDKISKVHEVINNLHISNLELRDDMSPDIAPYVNERKLDIILVRLSSELARFKERYICIMDPHVRLLVRLNILRGDTGNISKGRIFHLTREFQSRPNKTGNYGQIMKTLNILLTMYHAYELMIRHGLRAFLHFYENHSDKFWMENEVNLHDLLTDIKAYLGPFPVIEPLPDGSVPDVPNNLIFGHNKFHKLKELLERHFKLFREKNKDTRAIVFVEYRDIVNEVYVLLLQCRPLIRPQMFVGQAGQKQKQQIQALENFRSNLVNVLISTSVGEEGLDVGEVDLIICFDISQSSPIRLVQRMGRTGRQRDGHIIALVTDGKEHQSLKATMSRRDSLNNKVLQSSDIVSVLYEESPRMVPNEFEPECRKRHMKIQAKSPQVKGAKKRKQYEKKRKQNVEFKKVDREVDPILGSKSAGQSSMENFFKPSSSNANKEMEFHPFFGSQTSKAYNFGNCTQEMIKPENVKLLLSDNEAVDFLTLCLMRKSQTDCHILDTKIDTKYIPSYPSKSLEVLDDFTVPDLDILECLGSLQTLEISLDKAQDQNFSICQNEKEIFEANRLENELHESRFENSEATIAMSFTDLICDFSSSEEEICKEVENKLYEFENLLNETTDESEIEEHDLRDQNPSEDKSLNVKTSHLTIEENNEEANFSLLLENTSSDSEISQETSNCVILKKKVANFNDDNLFKQQHSSRDNSFFSFNSNSSGITVTQAIEEVGRINMNNSTNNNTLIKKQNSDRNQTRKKITSSFNMGIDNKIPSTSKVSNLNSQKKQTRFQISDSDDDLFDYIDEVSILKESNILKPNEPQGSDAVPIDNYQIMKVDSNKNTPLAQKENTNLQLNPHTTEDYWGSDFDVPATPVDSQKYFKSNDTTKTKAAKKFECFETDWITCAKKSSSSDDKKSMPAKKLSLFKGNNPSSTCNNVNNNKTSFFNNFNKVASKEDDDFEVFKKPVPRALNTLASNKINQNIPSTSYDRFNGYSASVSIEKALSSKVINKEKNEVSFNSSLEQSPMLRRKKMTKNKHNCHFLDNEADVSIDAGDTSEGTSGEDEDLEGFVSYTQDVSDHVDMKAHYLHSVRSPLRRPGAFLIKKPSRIEDNVYSQPVSQLNDTYLHDSFCIKENEIEYGEESNDDLEITCLQELKKSPDMKRKRKRINSPAFEIKRRKRKKGRIQTLNDNSSSEDETEKIRRQILEESALLKK